MSTKTYLTTLRLVLNEILASLRWQASKARATARAQRDSCVSAVASEQSSSDGSCPTKLRLVISMLLMMVLGVNSVKAEDDYSGYYYIANYKSYSETDHTQSYYLCPAVDPDNGDNASYYNNNTSMPFLTTYKTGQIRYSIWKIENAGEYDDKTFYKIQHIYSSKYIVHNDIVTSSKPYRLTLHLQDADPDDDSSLFEIVKNANGYCFIHPKEDITRSINPSAGNKDSYVGLGERYNNINTGGLIGVWVDNEDGRWYLENAQCTTPTISFNKVNSEVTIDHEEGETVYYSKNGINPDPNNVGGDNYTQEYNPNEKPTVSDNTIIKAIAVKSNMINSEMATKTIVVNPTINVIIPDGGYTYDGSAKDPEVSVEFSGTTLDPNEYEVNYRDNTDAGTATINITNVSGGNYIISCSTTFTINKAPLTITANDQTITYGEAPANSVEYSGFVGTETSDVLSGDLEYICDYAQYDDVGTFTITLSGLTSDNYDITFVGGTLTVYPKEVGLEWGTTELTYNGSEQTPTVTATGIINSEIGVTVTGGQTNVGLGYIATVTFTGDKAGNYKLPEANTKEFSIGKKSLTVTAKNHTITYGDAPAANGVTYSGFVPGEDESKLTGTPKYYFNYAQFDNVGDNYVITPYDLTATNYAITFAPGTLTVTQKEVGLSWETELTYSGVNQVPTATATGTVNGDVIGVTVTGGQKDVGSGSGYTATASALTGTKADNYKLPAANTTEFSIGKASLTVTANNHTITYGDAPANGGVTYTGFVGTDDSSVLGDALVYDYEGYTQYGNAGTYAITPSGLSSSNYDITYENGTLTVTPKEVRIEWGETDLTYNGSGQVPTATIKSRDDDIVNIDNDNDKVNNVVTVTASAKEGSALTEDGDAVNPGYYRATASFTGTKAGNYKPAPSSQSFKISGKTIGDGNEPAEGIDILLTQEGSNVVVAYVKDGGTTLNPNDDYTVDTEIQGFDTYITITGKGNYGGSVRKLFVKPEFFKPTGASEYAAVYRASSDLSNPTGITPYIVKKVNPSLGTINIASVGYLPKDVPVLMLADTDISGFEASSKSNEVTAITAETENSNLLKVAPESGVAVKDAQVYMFYKGEFVLTKEGTITEGKFYLDNPNYSATAYPAGSAGSRSVLRFVVGNSTGIVDVEKSEDSRTASGNDAWYLLDGRRLSGKPTEQGLYIWNGRKTVIKKK